MLLDGQLRPEEVELRADSHLQLSFADVGLDIIAADPGIAVVGGDHPSEHGDEGGLAGSVGSKQSECLFLVNFQVETFNGCIVASVSLFFIQFSEVVDDEGRIIYFTHFGDVFSLGFGHGIFLIS